MAICGWVLAILALHVKGISWANAGDPFFLLTASRPNSSIGGRIFKMEPGTYDSQAINFSTLLYNPIAVDYDPQEDRVYWSEVGLYRRIRRARLSGEDMETVLNTNGRNDSLIGGLAIDVGRRLLFYSDAKLDIIVKMDMKFFIPRNIVSSALDRPRAIVLDTDRQLIYWTDLGSSPKIERADYNGSNRLTLVNRGLGFINALALDLPNQKLYWADAYTDHVGTSDLSGKNPRDVLRLNGSGYHFFGLAFYRGSLYVTDWLTGTYTEKSRLIRVELNGNAKTVASIAYGRLNDIHAYSASDVSKAKWVETAVLAVVIALVIA